MRRVEREDGQILPLLVVGLLLVVLGVAALVLDVGRAYLVKRQLQSTADAAALAAATNLPDASKALAAAAAYGPEHKNAIPGLDVTQTARVWCLKSQTNCYGNTPRTAPTNGRANGVVVTEEADVPTTFGRLFGVDSINVRAKATACGNCRAQPLDIALVIDRTASMEYSGSMPILKESVKAFLESLDPSRAYVTLLVLPPRGVADECAAPQAWSASSRNLIGLMGGIFYPPTGDNTYTVVRMSNDYKRSDGRGLNPSSRLVHAVECLKPGGPTAYKQALMQAQKELVEHGSGRPNARRVIVFETDGAANTVPFSWFDASTLRPGPGHQDDFERPCGSALDYVNNVIKPSGTTVFTVAYSLAGDDDCYQAPHVRADDGSIVGYRTLFGVREPVSAADVVRQMATTGGAFTASTATGMTAAFEQIAEALMAASLVPDDEGD